MNMKQLADNLKIEWVDEYLGPGFKRDQWKPTNEQKIKCFDLAMDNNYKGIRGMKEAL